jgi:FixJ family two-component response regulator
MNERPEPVVYVVDDDEDVCKSLTALLDAHDLRAQVFDSAEAFLAGLDPVLPGCLLLDLRMPGTDGLELQQQLRDIDCDLPIIFITGHGDVQLAVRAIKAGATGFIEKPYDAQELIELVQEAIWQHVTSRSPLDRP